MTYPHLVSDPSSPVPNRYVRKQCDWCATWYELPRSLEHAYNTCNAVACRAASRCAATYREKRRTSYLPLLPTHPTKQDVVNQLVALHADGVELTSRVVSKRYQRLHRAIYNCFANAKGGPRHAALTAAGIDVEALARKGRAESLRKRIRYTPEVIDQILSDRIAHQLPVYPLALKQAGMRGLIEAAHRCVPGGFAAAVVKAGGVASQISALRSWENNPGAVEDALRDRVAMDLPMNAGALQVSDNGLFQAACKKYGDWNSALLAVGLDPDKIQRCYYTDIWQGLVFQNIAREILLVLRPDWNPDYCFHYTDECVKRRHLRPDWCDLISGHWIDAKLDAWGTTIDLTIAKYLPHTEVLHILTLRGTRPDTSRVKFHSIFDLEAEDVNAELVEQFDTLRVLAASKLKVPRLVRWARKLSPADLIAGILALPEEHRHSRGVQKVDSALYNAVRKHFGSWNDGLLRCGLDPADYRKHKPYLSREAVDAAIRARADDLNALRQRSLQATKEGQRLINSACYHYGRWPDALAANDLVIPRARISPTAEIERR